MSGISWTSYKLLNSADTEAVNQINKYKNKMWLSDSDSLARNYLRAALLCLPALK